MSSWTDFLNAALVGSERGSQLLPPSALAESLGGLAAQAPEQAFLSRAGALALWRQAGHPLPEQAVQATPSEPSTQPLISEVSTMHLRQMLGGKYTAVLPEWLAEVSRVGRTIPPELLPALLELTAGHPTHAALARSAGGNLANWLAARNPNWSGQPILTESWWETGTLDQRLEIFTSWRSSAPDEARQKLETVWKTESAPHRLKFIRACETGLSLSDEAFLTAALTDRSKDVKMSAVDLLRRLPGSSYAQRLAEYITPLLRFERAITVEFPEDFLAAGKTYGLDPFWGTTAFTVGEKAALLMLMLSSAPITHWTATTGQSVADLIGSARKSEFSKAILQGWAMAACRQQAAEWAQALLKVELETSHVWLDPTELLTVLPPETRLAELEQMLDRATGRSRDWQLTQSVCSHLPHLSGAWTDGLAGSLLRLMSKRLVAYYIAPRELEKMLQSIPRRFLAMALRQWPEQTTDTQPAREYLAFRQEALTALSQL